MKNKNERENLNFRGMLDKFVIFSPPTITRVQFEENFFYFLTKDVIW